MHPKNKVFKNLKYEAWIRKKPCLICGTPEVECHHVWCTGKKNGRNSMTSVPLCVAHHQSGFPGGYHQLELKRWEDMHGICVEWEIINLLSEYIQENV